MQPIDFYAIFTYQSGGFVGFLDNLKKQREAQRNVDSKSMQRIEESGKFVETNFISISEAKAGVKLRMGMEIRHLQEVMLNELGNEKSPFYCKDKNSRNDLIERVFLPDISLVDPIRKTTRIEKFINREMMLNLVVNEKLELKPEYDYATELKKLSESGNYTHEKAANVGQLYDDLVKVKSGLSYKISR